MVKTPSVRHSKSRKDPVTIDLEASPVNRDSDPQSTGRASPEPSLLGDTSATEDAQPPVVEGAGFTMTEPVSKEIPVSESPTASDEALLAGDESKNLSAESTPTGKEPENTSEKPDMKHADEAPRRGSPVAPVKSEPRRNGLSAIAAGIIGGVVTLVGAGALQYGGLLPAPGGSGGDAVAIEGLRAEIASLQTELATLKTAGSTGIDAQAVADLQARIATLADDVGALKSAVESGGAGENAGLAALDSKIAELQTQLSAVSQSAGGAAVDLTPLNDRIAALEEGIKAATDELNAGDGRLATLEETVASLSGKIDAQANQPKIALSIAASALKAAIERGQPFAAELETLAAISPDVPQLAGLRARAETGVATRDDLLAEMDGAANAMIAAADPADPNAGYLDQLLESAASLVTVRPVGSVEGAGVPETVARMEAALKAGDLAKVVAEYDTLPEAAKAAGSGFAARIKARLDVEALVDQAIAEAMKTV
ncbi:MAG: phage tail protein [Rhizobiaceae bacterium]|nr:phage tail protein [Rhizobiaceae bacterium]